jgi:hypothetical protein
MTDKVRKGGVVDTRILTTTVFLVGVLVVVLGAAGVSGASKNGESTKPTGPHIPRSGGYVHITGFSDNDGPTSRVVVTGVIGDFGTAVRTTSPGSSNTKDNELDLRLTRGSFGLNIAGIESNLLAAITGHFPTNATTCSGEVSVSGRATVD